MMYIDPRSKVFGHLDRVQAWRQGNRPAPVTVEWDLSNRCVLGCQDCHFAHTHVKGPWVTKSRSLPMAFDSTGDLADFDMVKHALQEMVRAGVRAVVWSGGGEPTTHPKWEQVVQVASKAGIYQGMYTLGGLLTPGSAWHLAEHLAWVVVSLDCADAATYTAEKGVSASKFDAACDGVRWLAAADSAVVGVSFLIHKNNYLRMWDMLTLSRSLGATYTTFRPAIQFDPRSPSTSTDDREWMPYKAHAILRSMEQEADVEIDVSRFDEYANWQGHGYADCKGIRLNTTITPDGRVWVCPQRRGIEGSCLGDLRTESFDDIWARHPGVYKVDSGCRIMCRLHPVNQVLDQIDAPHVHGAFI